MNNPPLPVKLPHELRIATLIEMEPGERGWCNANALRIDVEDRMWIIATCIMRPECEPGFDVAVRRNEHGFEVAIPDHYKLPRCYNLAGLTLAPVTAVEIMSGAESLGTIEE